MSSSVSSENTVEKDRAMIAAMMVERTFFVFITSRKYLYFSILWYINNMALLREFQGHPRLASPWDLKDLWA
jgi:hypothetical protein